MRQIWKYVVDGLSQGQGGRISGLRPPALESLEPRVLLSGDPWLAQATDPNLSRQASDAIYVEARRVALVYKVPDLAGLAPVGLVPEDLAGQVIYLDLDGANDVVYHGPVAVGPFDVPALALTGRIAGQDQVVADRIVAELDRVFAGAGVTFTARRPQGGQAYSTIYVMEDSPAFMQYGDFAGLAERIDLGNECPNDNALVFAHELTARADDLDGVVAAITDEVAHEIGHLVGYVHAADADLLRSGAIDPVQYGLSLSNVAHEAGVDERYVTYSLVREKIETAGTYVHQWIAQQGAQFYQSQFQGSEIASYLGTIAGSNDDKWYPVDTQGWSQFVGDDLLEGVYEEDTMGIWLRHFVAGGDGTELTTGLAKVPKDDDLILDTLLKGAVTAFIVDPQDGRYLSAYEAATAMWQQALDGYRQGNKALAYYYLGRVAHLVADMSTPSHVHLDRHAAIQNDADFYEATTSAGSRFLLWGVNGQRGAPTGEIRDYTSLEDLLVATIDYTEEYPSWNQAGTLQVAGDDEAEIADAGRHRPDLVTAEGGWNMDDYWIMADDLMPWAMEQTAALYRLFYSQVDADAPTVEWVTAFGNSEAEAIDQSARLRAEVRAEDLVSGYQADGFSFVIEKKADGGWSLYYNPAPNAGILGLRLAENGVYRIQVSIQDAVGNVGFSDYGYFSVADALTCPPLVTVDRVRTPDTTPGLHGTIDDPAAEIAVEVGGRTYQAFNNGDGTWTLPDDAISPALLSGTYDVKVTATDSLGNVGTDDTTDELVIRLFEEDFSNGDLSQWMIVDQGNWWRPSRWSVSGGALTQTSKIVQSQSRGSIARIGTFAVYREGTAWTDYNLALSLRSQDEGDVGVMFRYQDPNNYYRFSWNRRNGYRRLVRCQNGRFTELAHDAVRYEKGRTYQVAIKAHGPLLEVRIDGQEVFSVVDMALSGGTIALYSCENQGSVFDNIVGEGLVGVNIAPRISSVKAAPDLITDRQTTQLQVSALDYDHSPSPLTYCWIAQDGQGTFDDPTRSDPVYLPPDVSHIQTFTLTVQVSDGQDTVQGTVDINVRDADAPVLLAEDFGDGDFDGWSIVQEGNWYKPARWSAFGGVLSQISKIYRINDGIAARGTFAAFGAGAGWTDYEVSLALRSDDVNDLGVMFRYQNPNNYYRFSWNSQAGYARLVRCVGGQFQVLASSPFKYVKGRTYVVGILAWGSRFQVYADGGLLLASQDSRLGFGGIAMYGSRNTGSVFDDVLVRVV